MLTNDVFSFEQLGPVCLANAVVAGHMKCHSSKSSSKKVVSNSLVSKDNFSLTKIICHRNFGNEFAFTRSKDYLYYLAGSPLSQIFDDETLPQN